jgi:3-hydroxybutyryl-CoA dehydrogenase
MLSAPNKRSWEDAMSEVKRVTVVGAGTMGHGIAQVAAGSGINVIVSDVSKEAIDMGLAAVRANLAKGIEKGKVTPAQKVGILQRIHAEPDLAAAVSEADVVIEAVPELLDLKREIFAVADAVAPSEALLGSNTSSLSISRIAEATSRPERVVGLHFFNPVHLMELVEVVRGKQTSDETMRRAAAFSEALGKEAIAVKDSPGFASSRLGLVLGLEAMRMVEDGVASAEDIDKVMTKGYRHPMGPLRLTDLVGLDVRLSIAEYLHSELGSDAFRPPEILRRMVAEGRLGKKTGRGFHEWES